MNVTLLAMTVALIALAGTLATTFLTNLIHNNSRKLLRSAISSAITIVIVIIVILLVTISSVFILTNYLPSSSNQTSMTQSHSTSMFTSVSTTSTASSPAVSLSSSSTSISQSSSSFAPYVNQTLLLNNGTIVSGNVAPNVGNANAAVNFEGLAVDTLNGHIAIVGQSLWIIDGKTGLPIRQVAAGGFGVAFDPQNGNYYVAGGDTQGATVTVVSGSMSAIIDTIRIPSSNYSFESHIVFNPSNGYLYAVGYSSNVSVINAATNSFVTNIPIGGATFDLTVDNQSGNVYVTQSNPHGVAVVNGSSNEVISFIAISAATTAIAYDSSSGYVYVGERYNYVAVVNPSSNTIVTQINLGVQNGVTFGLAVDPASGKIYDTGSTPNGIQVISDKTNSVTGTITLNNSAGVLTFDPLNGYFYVAGEASGIVAIVDGTSNVVVKYIFVVQNPTDVVYDGGNGNLYVSESGSGMITIVNSATLKILNEVYIGGSINYMTLGNGKIYLAEQNGSIIVFNTATDSTVGSIDVGGFPSGLAFDSVDSHLYVATGLLCGVGVCFGPQTVAVVDTNTNKVLTNISILEGFPTSVAYDQSNGKVYVADNGFCHGAGNCAGGYHVSIIDARNDSIVGDIHVNGFPSSLLFDPVDNHLYVTYGSFGNMSIIDTKTNTVIDTINLVPNMPNLFSTVNRMMFDPSSGLVYVTVSTVHISTNVSNMSSDLFVLNGSTNDIISKLTLGLNPFGVAISDQYVYVANQESGTISVVSTS